MLKERFAKAGLSAEIEVYADSAHGRCPPDSRVYNEGLAEKAWSRLLVWYGENLGVRLQDVLAACDRGARRPGRDSK